VTPALIDFWTAMADPVVECVESHIFDDESGIGGGGNNRVPEAPVDGHVYGRGNKAWTLIPDLTAPPITGGGS
jgi:hypothetical protein